MKLTRTAFAVPLAALLIVSACGDDDESSSTTAGASPTITIASGNFSESQLLAEIYGQALENGGQRVARKDPIGSRELYYQAIANEEINLVPEYTNSLLSYLLSQQEPPASPEATTIDEQVDAINEALPDNLTVGAPSSAEDKDVIVCTQEVADQYSLANLSDLAPVAGELRLGAPPEFETRTPFGLNGFKDILGVEFGEYIALDIAAIPDALKGGTIDCGNLFSTMPVITTEGFVSLADDQPLAAFEAVLPLLTADIATPEVLAILDAVSASLTTEILKEMMVAVDVDQLAPDVVAKGFLAGEYTGAGTATTDTGAPTDSAVTETTAGG
jgi:osmoprotectant transport system substrate-binding protein